MGGAAASGAGWRSQAHGGNPAPLGANAAHWPLRCRRTAGCAGLVSTAAVRLRLARGCGGDSSALQPAVPGGAGHTPAAGLLRQAARGGSSTSVTRVAHVHGSALPARCRAHPCLQVLLPPASPAPLPHSLPHSPDVCGCAAGLLVPPHRPAGPPRPPTSCAAAGDGCRISGWPGRAAGGPACPRRLCSFQRRARGASLRRLWPPRPHPR